MNRPASQPIALHPAETIIDRRLPSGRTVTLQVEGAREAIEIRSAEGEVDLRIVLTDAGPVVSLRGARLELASPEVAVTCKKFEVHAEDEVRLASDREVRIDGDEVRMNTERDIHLNGAYIRLNCSADLQVPVAMPDVSAVDALFAPQTSCCDEHEPR